MQTLPPTTVTSKPLQFQVGASIPYIWGAQDAALGQPCMPEQFFVTRPDQKDYAAGWASVAGESETTLYFLGA